MTKLNFAAMSDKELKAHIQAHRDDQEAFHVYCDRLYARPGIKITSMEQFEELIREREEINPPTQSD